MKSCSCTSIVNVDLFWCSLPIASNMFDVKYKVFVLFICCRLMKNGFLHAKWSQCFWVVMSLRRTKVEMGQFTVLSAGVDLLLMLHTFWRRWETAVTVLTRLQGQANTNLRSFFDSQHICVFWKQNFVLLKRKCVEGTWFQVEVWFIWVWIYVISYFILPASWLAFRGQNV